MKFLKKVSAKEVKRAFVIADGIRTPKKHERHLGKITLPEFRAKLAKVKKRILPLDIAALDRRIRWQPRIRSYGRSDWYLGVVSTREVGVWRRAGGLPILWTNGSLNETALKVHYGLAHKSKLLAGRARKAITNILQTNVLELQKEKYLLPIIFKGGTGTNGRHSLKRKMRGDIDDGNMRAIALATSDMKKIKVYIGIPKKKKRR